MRKREPQTFCLSSLRHASNIFIHQVCGAPRTFLFKFHINFKAIGILEWCCYSCEVNNVSLIGLIRITSWEHQSALKPLLRLLSSLPLQCKLQNHNIVPFEFFYLQKASLNCYSTMSWNQSNASYHPYSSNQIDRTPGIVYASENVLKAL